MSGKAVKEIEINKLAETSSDEDIPHQLSGDPNKGPREKPKESKQKAPPHFITRVYLISIAMLVFSVTEWSFLAQIDVVKTFVIAHSEWLLLFFWISFLQLLVLIFFYDAMRKRSKTFWYIMVLTAVQTSSTVLAVPLITAFSEILDLVYALLTIVVIVLISILFSTLRQLQIEHSPEYVIVGGIRTFMICSVGNLMSQTTSLSPFFEVITSIIIIPFLTCFILVCAKTIGTDKFYKAHGNRIPLCALSCYYFYLSLYANLLTFFLNISLVSSH